MQFCRRIRCQPQDNVAVALVRAEDHTETVDRRLIQPNNQPSGRPPSGFGDLVYETSASLDRRDAPKSGELDGNESPPMKPAFPVTRCPYGAAVLG
jgi:hypothetical protein